MADELSQPNEPGQANQPMVAPTKFAQFHQDLLRQQNLIMGVLAGLAAAIIGALIWTVVTVTTHYQIGWMAVGIGFLVGYAVRYAGKGLTMPFGVAGAVLALFGCVVGNFLTGCEIVAEQYKLPLFAVLSKMNLDVAVEMMKATFQGMDLLFYGIAVYEGYRFSFRQVTAEELAALR